MSLEIELFKLISKKKYPEAITLLNNKEVNINALDEEGCSLLMAAVRKSLGAPKERYAFIEQVLSNPNFQHANKPIDGVSGTSFEMAIIKDDVTLVELILKYKEDKGIEVIFNKDKLLYEQQAREVQLMKEQMKNEPAMSLANYLDKQQKIMASLLNATVLHAIKTDDPSLLQRLFNAGAKLHHPLKDGTYTMDLVRDKEESAVYKWLSKYIKEQISSSSSSFFAASSLARKHGEKEQALVEKQIQSTRESIMKMFKFHDISDKQLAGKEEPKPQQTPK
ncbi:MAG: hypothetical protein P4L65_10570 [Legionella sp.]|nr:hypothetical protein [Legionella sp.]